MKAAEYLAAVKAKLNITSDYALAKALGITRQAASKYARGETVPSALVGFKIAELLGEQPAGVIAELEAERAEKAGNAADADAWKGIVRKLGGTAASILLACGLGGFSNADAKLAAPSGSLTGQSSYRAKKRKKATWFPRMVLSLF
jgi:transcriptional regulator with XRE-family HTH domain